jgi:predicted Zn-dependent peptidase
LSTPRKHFFLLQSCAGSYTTSIEGEHKNSKANQNICKVNMTFNLNLLIFFRNICLILDMTTAMSWRRNILPNGLTVLQFPRQSANTTQLSIAVEYGSNQEPEEIAGVAHFLEHMIAGGSTKRIQLSRSIENSGGILDFYTDHEHMMSTMDILPSELTKASFIISELLFNTDFEEEKFRQERKIILNELSEALDDPTERIEELLMKSLFKKHPVNRPVGGFPKTVKRLKLNELSTAHKTNYIPQNMILILTGNFSEETATIVLNNFKDRSFEKTPSKKAIAVETAKPVPLVVEKKPGIAQSYLSMGARTVCSSHRDAPTLDTMSALLSGGTSSRLFIELREKTALTYDINSDHNKGLDFGYFSISCAVKNKNLVKAKQVILKELAKLRITKVPNDELEKTKNLIMGAILRGMDDPQECLEILAYMDMQYKSEKALVNHIAKIKDVSSEDIMDAANNYLKEDCFSTVLLKPMK